MVIKIKLKNVDKYCLLDHEVFEALNSLPNFKEYHVFDHLREHSSGVPVFQKYHDTVNGKLNVESIYLALFIAKRYIPKPETIKRLFLTFLNGDKLDLRLKNLRWEEMSKLSRNKTSVNNKTGFRGVRRTPREKYVAMISDGVKQIYLGTYDTPEEAALAYNKRSIEMFGVTGILNPIDESGKPIPHEVPDQVKSRQRKSTHKVVVTNPVEVDKISLLPVHFESVKKRVRKMKSENRKEIVDELENTNSAEDSSFIHDRDQSAREENNLNEIKEMSDKSLSDS